MVPIASYPTLDDAEEAGEKLIANGMTVKFDGDLANGTNIILYVDDDAAARATSMLELVEAEEDKRFHPCPTCGADEPVWYGKRKVILAFILMGAAFAIGRESVQVFLVALLLALLITIVVGRNIPDFECRNCHTRFTSANPPRRFPQ